MMASDNRIKISPSERKGGNGKRSKGFVNFPMIDDDEDEDCVFSYNHFCVFLIN